MYFNLMFAKDKESSTHHNPIASITSNPTKIYKRKKERDAASTAELQKALPLVDSIRIFENHINENGTK